MLRFSNCLRFSLAAAGKVADWKVYFQDESRFGLMMVLRWAITEIGSCTSLTPLSTPTLLWNNLNTIL